MESTLQGQNIGWLDEQDRLGNLVISPPYQRRFVWSQRHKVYFIDTLLRDLPIPKLYLQQKIRTTQRGGRKTKYYVVDGQQRIRAILDFLSGDLTYSRRYHPKTQEFLEEYEDMGFQDLPRRAQRRFLGYSLPTEMITQASTRDIKDMYIRLNLNTMKLSKQEIRNAMFDGDFKKLAYSLGNDPFWQNQRVASRWDIRRMRDVEYISELLMAMLQGIQDKKKKLDDCYAQNETMDEDVKANLQRDIGFIKTNIEEILPRLRTTRFKNKGDFYSLFMSFYRFHQEGLRFPSDLTPIRETLLELNRMVSRDAESENLLTYFEGCSNSPDSMRNRRFRIRLLDGLLRPLFVETDERRNFTEEQKQFIWHREDEKTCAICNEMVDSYDDYQPDHEIPWSRGGPTSVTNGRITHQRCNIGRGNR